MRFVLAWVVSGLALALVIRLAVGGAPDAPVVDPAVASRGAQVSSKCVACHAFDSRDNHVGPHLVGILGRQAGGLAAFAYSDAMRQSGVVWDKDSLKQFVMGPQQFIPGTNMGVSPLTEPEADELVSYLESMQ